MKTKLFELATVLFYLVVVPLIVSMAVSISVFTALSVFLGGK